MRITEHLAKAPMDEKKMSFILHTNNYKGAEELATLVESKTGVRPMVMIMGPVIGSHVGPGAVACGWISEKTRDELKASL